MKLLSYIIHQKEKQIMEQTAQNVEKIVKALSSLNTKELEIINKTISSAKKRKLPIQKMNALILAFETGEEMFFKDRDGKAHIGKIKKINQRFVRMYDEREKRIFNILPEHLKTATQADKNAVEAQNENAPRQKRSYVRRKTVPTHKTEIKRDEEGNIIYGRRK